jgi:tetratricopeptide (TPR) repeat protein
MTWLIGMILATALVLPHETPNNLSISAARAAVNEAEAAFGPRHPATAMMLRNLALAYQQAGFYNRAEETAQRSLALLEATFGPTDVSLTPVLNVLTETYAAQGRYVEARRLAMRAVAIGPDAGAHYATALHNLGAVLEGVGKLNEASEYYRSALSAREALLPVGHPYIELTRTALERVSANPKAVSLSRGASR